MGFVLFDYIGPVLEIEETSDEDEDTTVNKQEASSQKENEQNPEMQQETGQPKPEEEKGHEPRTVEEGHSEPKTTQETHEESEKKEVQAESENNRGKNFMKRVTHDRCFYMKPQSTILVSSFNSVVGYDF